MRYSLPVLILLVCSMYRLQAQTDDSDTTQIDTVSQPVVTHIATLATRVGRIEIELYGNDAPRTVENFVELIEAGYYDGVLFHSVYPRFYIQSGDPKSRDTNLKSQWGTGGESKFGRSFRDELDPSAPSFVRGYVRGTVAMANNGPNTNRSQFLIITRELPDLPRTNTIFGRVRGFEVVDSIAGAELATREESGAGIPLNPVRIMMADVSAVSETDSD